MAQTSTQVDQFEIDFENELLNIGYSQIKLIGKGGFGVVFKASKDNSTFAIKIPTRSSCKKEIEMM